MATFFFNENKFNGVKVKVIDGDIDSSLHLLRHLLRKEGWYIEKEKRLCYTKPSEARRKKRIRAKLKSRRE